MDVVPENADLRQADADGVPSSNNGSAAASFEASAEHVHAQQPSSSHQQRSSSSSAGRNALPAPAHIQEDNFINLLDDEVFVEMAPDVENHVISADNGGASSSSNHQQVIDIADDSDEVQEHGNLALPDPDEDAIEVLSENIMHPQAQRQPSADSDEIVVMSEKLDHTSRKRPLQDSSPSLNELSSGLDDTIVILDDGSSQEVVAGDGFVPAFSFGRNRSRVGNLQLPDVVGGGRPRRPAKIKASGNVWMDCLTAGNYEDLFSFYKVASNVPGRLSNEVFPIIQSFVRGKARKLLKPGTEDNMEKFISLIEVLYIRNSILTKAFNNDANLERILLADSKMYENQFEKGAETISKFIAPYIDGAMTKRAAVDAAESTSTLTKRKSQLSIESFSTSTVAADAEHVAECVKLIPLVNIGVDDIAAKIRNGIGRRLLRYKGSLDSERNLVEVIKRYCTASDDASRSYQPRIDEPSSSTVSIRKQQVDVIQPDDMSILERMIRDKALSETLNAEFQQFVKQVASMSMSDVVQPAPSLPDEPQTPKRGARGRGRGLGRGGAAAGSSGRGRGRGGMAYFVGRGGMGGRGRGGRGGGGVGAAAAAAIAAVAAGAGQAVNAVAAAFGGQPQPAMPPFPDYAGAIANALPVPPVPPPVLNQFMLNGVHHHHYHHHPNHHVHFAANVNVNGVNVAPAAAAVNVGGAGAMFNHFLQHHGHHHHAFQQAFAAHNIGAGMFHGGGGSSSSSSSSNKPVAEVNPCNTGSDPLANITQRDILNCQQNGLTNIYVDTLSQSTWPIQVTTGFDCKALPERALNAFELFANFFMAKKPKRHLQLQPKLGNAEILLTIPNDDVAGNDEFSSPKKRAESDNISEKSFDAGCSSSSQQVLRASSSPTVLENTQSSRTYVIHVTTAQMIVLQHFETDEPQNFEDLLERTCLPPLELTRALEKLCMPTNPKQKERSNLLIKLPKASPSKKDAEEDEDEVEIYDESSDFARPSSSSRSIKAEPVASTSAQAVETEQRLSSLSILAGGNIGPNTRYKYNKNFRPVRREWKASRVWPEEKTYSEALEALATSLLTKPSASLDSSQFDIEDLSYNEQQRQGVIDARLMAIIKQAKLMGEDELIAQVRDELKVRFFTSQKFVKERLDNLITRNLIKKEQRSKKVKKVRYVP